jgi:hypothetical protein
VGLGPEQVSTNRSLACTTAVAGLVQLCADGSGKEFTMVAAVTIHSSRAVQCHSLTVTAFLGYLLHVASFQQLSDLFHNGCSSFPAGGDPL